MTMTLLETVGRGYSVKLWRDDEGLLYVTVSNQRFYSTEAHYPVGQAKRFDDLLDLLDVAILEGVREVEARGGPPQR